MLRADRSRARGRGRVGVDWPRLLLVGVPAAALLWLIVAVGLNEALRGSSPASGLAIAPWDARSKVRLAEQQIRRSKAAVANARAAQPLAVQALSRDATLAPAWRLLALGVAAAGDESRASRLMHFGSSASRRDLPTQLWLIEERVRAGDVSGALRHYDVALQTSRAAAGLLLPILAQASADDAVAIPLAELLRADPTWFDAFLVQLQQGGLDSGKVARLLERVAAGRAVPLPERYREVAGTMINRGDSAAGWRLLRLLARDEPRPAIIVNAGFEKDSRNPPYDWSIADQLGVTGELREVEGAAKRALVLAADTGDGGEVARQLLPAAPGRYRLGMMFGDLPDAPWARTYVMVRCATLNPDTLFEAELPRPSRARERASFDLVVPARCPMLWLMVGLRGNFDPGSTASWIDDVSLRRL